MEKVQVVNPGRRVVKLVVEDLKLMHVDGDGLIVTPVELQLCSNP